MSKELISRWKNIKEIYNDDELILILGEYDGEKTFALHWEHNFPSSNGKLSPLYLTETYAYALLTGLLQKSLQENNVDSIASLTNAIKHFKNMEN